MYQNSSSNYSCAQKGMWRFLPFLWYTFAISCNGNHYRLVKQAHLVLKHSEILVKTKMGTSIFSSEEGYLNIFNLLYFILTYSKQLTYVFSSFNLFFVFFCLFCAIIWGQRGLVCQSWMVHLFTSFGQLYAWRLEFVLDTFKRNNFLCNSFTSVVLTEHLLENFKTFILLKCCMF